MSKPSNPFEIILKNRFFPDGLTEQDIYNYWIKNKIEILTHLKGRRILFYLSDKNQKIIVRRYTTSDTPINLTELNFDKLITGRTVGLLEVFDQKSQFGVIDIDSPKSDEEISSEPTFDMVKDMTSQIYDFMSRTYKCQIIYTGKNGFHIRCEFERKMFMERIKEILYNQLGNKEEFRHFLQKRNERYPNIDLSPNMKNGALIIPRSLNKIGLPAVVVSRNDLSSFNREKLVNLVVTKK